MGEANITEIKTLNGYPLADTKAREDIAQLSEEIGELSDGFFEESKIPGKNLLNPNTFVPGYLNNGTIAESADWATCDYIYVGNLTDIVASNRTTGYGLSMFFLNKYDKDKKFISMNSQQDHHYAVEDGVAYVRFSVRTHTDPADIQVESGTVITEFEPYGEKVVITSAVEKLSNEIEVLDKKLTAITVPKPSSETENVKFEVLYSYILKSSGALMAMGTYQEQYCVSGLIEVTPFETLSITAGTGYENSIYVFYDASEQAVDMLKSPSGGAYAEVVDETVIVPGNAAFLRIAYNSNKRAGSVKRFVQSEEVELRKWHGKKWCVIGDSLTERNSRTTKNYHDYVAEATGIAVVNLGVSGTGYAKGADASRAFFDRVANVPVDSDAVTIFGSGNDLSSGLELGTPTDTGTETLCGCINTTIENLVAIMPAVQLGIVSPTPWVSHPPSNADSSMAKYCAAMKTICENRSIPFLDLYHCSNLRPWTEEGRAACYTKDDGNGVHPDEKGHALIAPRFKAFLESLIL